MNADRFSEIDEVVDFHRVRLALANGWRLLDIVKSKREVPYSNREFEEAATYIIGLPEGDDPDDSSETRRQWASAAITEIQRALAAHEGAVSGLGEKEQHQQSEAAKAAMMRAISSLERLA